VTGLDSRYSDPRASAAGWEETVRVLAQAQLFWLTTVRADGRPHVTPVVAVWDRDAVHFHTGEREQKWLNLRANPYVVLTTGCNTWDRGLDVVVEGRAEPVTEKAAIERLAGLWAQKWDGRWRLSATEGGLLSEGAQIASRVFTVRPTKVFAHAKGDPFGATTHRF
jgi:nitroimidazol reductase NimA-like FMN-containing flavoprotein (pyridoxamine 5'-phosphate oxidase superfamily)